MIPILVMMLSGLFSHPVCESRRVGPARAATCVALAWEAEARGFNPALVVELAWTESRWVPGRVNRSSGCVGLLQYQPKHWRDGFEALGFYLDKHGEVWRAICDYKTKGTPRCEADDPECCPASKALVRRARALDARTRG